MVIVLKGAHILELTFWLFLLHQGPSKRHWFHSWEFRVWYLGRSFNSSSHQAIHYVELVGSMIAILGMPLAVLIRRREPETVRYVFYNIPLSDRILVQ